MKPTDLFDNFEFKPLTEGLGFHKKADKQKKDTQRVSFSVDGSVSGESEGRAASASSFDAAGPDLSLDPHSDSIPRRASQSISDLIASLPPSLDFLDDKDDDSVISSSNPYIARSYEAPSGPQTPKSRNSGREKSSGRATAKRGGGLSSAFMSPSSDAILPSVSAAAANAASLFGELTGPRPGALGTPAPARPSTTIAAQSGPQISLGSRPWESAPRDADRESSKIFQPLPREDFASPFTSPKPSAGSPVPLAGSGSNARGATLPPAPQAASTAANGAMTRAPAYADKIQDEFARAFPHASGKKRRIETPASELVPQAVGFSAAALDAIVISGLSALCLVCILAITKADLSGLLANAQTDGPTQAHLVLLFIVVLNLYMLTARSFFGATLGEWAFDAQLGDGVDQTKIAYPLRALARSLVMTVTGFLPVPLISLLSKKDFGRAFSGLQLYRRP